MHELSVIRPIVQLVIKIAKDNDISKVTGVRLAIGEMHDLQEEWINKYYERFCKDTILEGSVLTIKRIPITYRCKKCGAEMRYSHFDFAGVNVVCSECGSAECEMTAGRELQIEGLEYSSSKN